MDETQTNNIFDKRPSLSSDEALERLRHQLTPKESYFCKEHLSDFVDKFLHKNHLVGSIKRYLLIQPCAVCGEDAQFVVID